MSPPDANPSRLACRLAVASLLAAVSASPGHAWSKYVHELICEMALEQLSSDAPDARAGAIRLSVGQNAASGYRTFAASCQWADDVRRDTHRETYEYHFINVPRSAGDLDFGRDCGAHDCASQAVVRYAVYLSDADLDEDDRAEALRFLGHFVADLHQPLHVGFEEDSGGNFLFVALAQGQTPNKKLHGIWDGTIPARLGLRAQGQGSARTQDMRRIARELLSEVTPAERSAWRTRDVRAWARESYRAAVDCAYRLACSATAAQLANGNFLSASYWTGAEAIAERRIQQAAIRLAFLVELAFQGPIHGPSLEGG